MFYKIKALKNIVFSRDRFLAGNFYEIDDLMKNKIIENYGTDSMLILSKPVEKHKRVFPVKYKMGVIVPVYNRYEILVSTLLNIQACRERIRERVKVVLVDDGSTDSRVKKLLSEYLYSYPDITIIENRENCGKKQHGLIFMRGVAKCYDCEYVFFYPQDFAMNLDGVNIIKKYRGLLKGDVKLLTFFRDNRNNDKSRPKFCWRKPYNDDFEQIKIFDGGFGLMRWEFARGIGEGWRENPLWPNISDLITASGEMLQYKKSIGEHVGNNNSAMHTVRRKDTQITAVDLNLFD